MLLTTFSQPLASALQRKLRSLTSSERVIGATITVKPISAEGYDLYSEEFGQPNLAPAPLIRSLLQDAAGLLEGHGSALQFLQNEWADVVDAWHLKTWDEYHDVSVGDRLPPKRVNDRTALYRGILLLPIYGQ